MQALTYFSLSLSILASNILFEQFLTLSCSNAGRNATHTFSFSLTTSIPSNAYLTLEVPPQYQPLRAVDCIKAECDFTEQAITWRLGSVTAGPQQLKVWMANPTESGLTGPFHMTSFWAGQPVDLNYQLPGVKIEEACQSPISKSVIYESLYFKFALEATFPASSGIQVTFPADFKIEPLDLKCHFEGLGWKPTCFSDGQMVQAESPLETLNTKLTLCILGVSLPHTSGLTDSFELAMVNRTNPSIYFLYTEYPGLDLQPGTVVELRSEGGPLEQGKPGEYILDFSVNSPIPSSGKVTVGLPSPCQYCTSSLSLPCVCTAHLASVTLISSLAPGALQISFNIINPTEVPMLSFSVTTYNAAGAIIDQTLSLGSFPLTPPRISSVDIKIRPSAEESHIAESGVLQFYLETRASPTSQEIRIVLPAGVQCPAAIFCSIGSLQIPCQWDAPSKTLKVQTAAEQWPMSPLTMGSSDLGCRLDPTVSLGQQAFTFQVFVNGELKEESQFKYIPREKELTSPEGVAAGSLAVSVLHYVAGAPNVLRLALKPSILVEHAVLKLQFLTGFQPNLGWTQGDSVPCVLSADVLCLLGLSDGLPTLTIADISLTPGALFNISLPRVLNGAIGERLQVVLTTALLSGEKVEMHTYLSQTSLQSPSSSPLPQVTLTVEGSNTADDISTRFTLNIETKLNAGDALMLEFPTGYVWDVSATSFQARGSFPNFTASLFCQSKLRLLLLQAQKQTSPVSLSFDLPHNHMYASPPSLTLSAASQFTYNSTLLVLQAPSVLSFVNPSCSDLFPGPSLTSTRTLLAFNFQPSSRLPLQASISLLFPLTFSSLDQECFHLVQAPSGTQCRAEQSYVHNNVTYRRYVLSNFGSTDTGRFILRVFVTSGPAQSTVSILLLSNYQGDGTAKLIHSSVVSLTLGPSMPSVAVSPAFSSVHSSLAQPQNNLVAGKRGALHFLLTLTQSLLKCAQGALSGLRVTFPLQGFASQGSASPHPGSFTATSPPECFFNQTYASKCEFQGEILTIWTPLDSDLIAGAVYELIVSTEDSAGFTAPSSGQYLFQFETFTDSSALVESGEVWLWLSPVSFAVARVSVLNKAALQYTALQLHFTVSVSLNSVTHPSSPAYLYLELPFLAWKSDLGSALPNGAALPCVPTVSPVALQCFLEHGDPGPVRIRLEPTADLAVGDSISLLLTGFVNPKAGTDVAMCLHSFSHFLGSNPYWVMRESTCLNNVDTIMGQVLNPSSPDTLSPVFSPSLVGTVNADMTLQVQLKVSANAATTNLILLQLNSDFPVSPSPTCMWEAVPMQCYAMKQWVLVFLKGAIAPGAYSLKLSSVTLPPYQQLFKMTAYYLVDRKTVRIQPHSFSTLSLGNCVWSSIASVGPAYAFLQKTYRLAFHCDHQVPQTGRLVLTFPGAFSNSIQASTCLLGPGSVLQQVDVSCSVEGSQLSVGSWGQALPAGVLVEVEVVAKPNAPGVFTDFSIATYYEAALLMDQVIGSASYPLTVNPLPRPNAMPQLAIGATFIALHKDQSAVRSSGGNCGVLELSLTPDFTVIGGLGYLTIVSSRPISFATGIRCLWKGFQTRLGSCSVPALNTLKVLTSSDLPAGQSVSLEITATNVDYEQGICVLDGSGLYPLSLDLFIGSVHLQGQTYVEILPPHIDVMEVYYDHQTAAQHNVLVIKFQTPVAIPGQTGRLVLELPLFPSNLGYYAPNEQVPCLGVGALVSTGPQLLCYLMQSQVPTVVITGFAAVTASTAGLEFHLYKLQNPLTSGDDQIVSIDLSIVDVAQGWPGIKLAHRRVSHIFAVQPDTASRQSPSAPVLLGSNSVTSGISLQFFLPAMEAEDRYYLVLDSRLNLSLTPCSEAVCWYYSDAHTVVFKFSTHFAGALVTVKDFTAPAYELDSPLQISGIVIHSLEVSSVVTYSPVSLPYFHRLTNTAVLARADGVPNMYAQDREDWKISMTLNLPVPTSGGVQLKLTGDASFPESVCINGPGSQLAGILTCVGAGNLLTVSISQQQSAGTAIVLVVPVATGSATTLSVATFNSTPLTVQEEALVTPTYQSVPSFYNVIPLQLQIEQLYRYQDTGMLTLHFSLPAVVLPGKTLTLTVPAGVVPAAGGSLFCYVASHSTVCSQTGTSITIQSPAVSGIPLGFNAIQVTTSNADNSEQQGLYFNPTGGSGDYLISLTYENYTGRNVMAVLPRAEFTALSVKKGFVRAEARTFFEVSFTVPTAVDVLVFCLPTATPLGQTLFGSDLGTGVASQQALPCEGSGNISSASCILIHGQDMQPACVSVSGFTTLSAGATGQLFLGGITNPSDPGNGDRHVDFYAYGYLAGQRVCAQVLFGLYTLQPPPALVYNQLPAPTLQDYHTNTPTTLTISCSESSLTIFQLPIGFTPTIATTSVCTPYVPWNWYVCTTCAQTIDLLATSFKSALSDRIIVKMQSDTVTHYAPFAALLPFLGGSASLVPQYSLVPQSKTDFWKAYYSLTQALPSGGCFQVEYSVSSAQTACWPSAGSSFAKADYSCSISGTTLTFLGLSGNLPVGTVLSVIAQLNSGQQASLSASFTTWAVCNESQIEASSSPTPYTVTGSGAAAFTLSSVLGLREAVLQGGRGEIRFYLIPPATITTAMAIDVKLDFQPSDGVFCEIIGAVSVAALCSLQSPNTVHIISTADLPATQKLEVRISATSQDQGLHGLIFSSSRHHFEVSISASGVPSAIGVLDYTPASGSFGAVRISPLHVSHKAPNVFTLTFTNGAQALTATDEVNLEFPSSSEDGQTPYFADDLGTGQTGADSEVSCNIAGYTGSPRCVLVRGNRALKINPRVVVKGGLLAAGTQAIIKLAGIWNPDASSSSFQGDDFIMYFRLYSASQSGLVYCDQYMYSVYSLDLSPQQTFTAAWSSASQALTWASQSYTLSLTGVPAGLTPTTLLISCEDTYVYLDSALTGTYFRTHNTLQLAATGLSTSLTIKAPPHSLSLADTSVYVIVLSGGLTLYLGKVLISFPTALSRDSLTGFSLALQSHEYWWQELWGPLTALVTTTTPVPGAYLRITLNTDFDTGSVMPRGFGTDIEKVRWRTASGNIAWFWGFGSLTNPTLGADVYVKGVADVLVTVDVCLDLACTQIFASDSVSIPVPTSLYTVFPSPTYISSKPKALQGNLSWQINFQLTTPMQGYNTADDYESLCLKLLDFGIGLAGDLTTCFIDGTPCSYGMWDPIQSQYCLVSSTGLAAGSHTADFSLIAAANIGPVAPAVGYTYVPLFTWKQSDSTVTNYELLRVQVVSQNDMSGCPLFQSLGGGALSVVNAYIDSTANIAQGSLLFFVFAGPFDAKLGYSVQGGDPMPAYSAVSGTNCFFTQVSSFFDRTVVPGLYPAIACVLGSSVAASTMKRFAFSVYTPVSSSVPAYKEMLLYTYSNGAPVLTAYGGCAQTDIYTSPCSIETGLPRSGVRSGNLFTFDQSFNLANTAASSSTYFLLALGPDFDSSLVTAIMWVTVELQIPGPAPCPCVLLRYSGPSTLTPTVEVRLQAPVTQNSFTILVYPLISAPSCDSPYSFTLTTGSVPGFETLTLDNTGPFYTNQDILLQLSFSASRDIPANSCIQLQFLMMSGVQVSTMALSGPTALLTVETSLLSSTLSLTKVGFIAAHSTVRITGVYATVTAPFQITVETFALSDCTGRMHSGSTQAPTTAVPAYLSRDALASSLLTGDHSGANQVLVFSPTFRSLPQPVTEIRVIFPSALSTALRYLAVWESNAHTQLLASKVEATGSTLRVLAPSHIQPEAGQWTLTVTAQEGLTLPKDLVIRFEWTSSAGTESAGDYSIPVFSHFQALSVQNLGTNADFTTALLIQMTIKTVTSATPEVLLQFEGRSDTLGTGLDSGDVLPCGVYTGTSTESNLVPTAICRLYSAGDFTAETSVVVKGLASLTVGKVVSLVLGGLKNPLTGSTTDLRVTTQTWTTSGLLADQRILHDSQLFEAAVLTSALTFAQVNSLAPTMSLPLVGAVSDWHFALSSPSLPISAIVLRFDPTLYTMDYLATTFGSTKAAVSITSGSLLSLEVLLAPTLGWMVLKLPSSVSVAFTLDIVGAKGPMHVSTTLGISAFSVSVFTNRLSTIVDVYAFDTVPFSPAELWLAASTSPTNPLGLANPFGTLSNVYPANTLFWFKVQLKTVNPVPSAGYLAVEFKNWQSVGSCFSSIGQCNSATTWTIQGSFPPNTIVEVWGQVTSPVLDGVYQVEVSSRLDQSQVIDLKTRDIIITACCGLAPTGFFAPVPVDHTPRLARSNQIGVLSLVFKPGFLGTLNLSAPGFQVPALPLCRFSLQSTPEVSYTASCTSTSVNFLTSTLPVDQPHLLQVYGVTFPDYVSVPISVWTVQLKSGSTVMKEWQAAYQVLPAATSQVKVVTKCASAGRSESVLLVSIATSLTSPVTVIFPAQTHLGDTHFPTSNSQGLDRSCKTSAGSAVPCVEKHLFPVYWTTHSVAVELSGTSAFVPGVTNPPAQETAVSIGVFVFGTVNGQRVILDGTSMLAYSTESTPQSLSKPSFLKHLANPSTGYGTWSLPLYLDATEGAPDLTLSPGQSLLLAFSFPIDTDLTVTRMAALFPSHGLALVTNSGGTPLTFLTITMNRLLTFDALNPPSITVLLISSSANSHAQQIVKYQDSTNFAPAVNTAVITPVLPFLRNVKTLFGVSFTNTNGLLAGSAVKVTILNFKLESCIYVSQTLASVVSVAKPTLGELHPCSVAGNSAVLRLLRQSPDNTQILLSLWGTPSVAGANSATVLTYIEGSPNLSQGLASVSVSVNANYPLSIVKATSPMLQSDSRVVFQDSIAPLSLSVTLSTAFNPSDSITFTFESDVLTFVPLYPPYLTCIWTSQQRDYLASGCQLNSGILQIWAPKHTSFAKNTPCTLTVTSTLNKGPEGLQFLHPANSYIAVLAQTGVDMGQTSFLLPPRPPSTLDFTPLSHSTGLPTALSLQFKSASDLVGEVVVTFSEVMLEMEGVRALPCYSDLAVVCFSYGGNRQEVRVTLKSALAAGVMGKVMLLKLINPYVSGISPSFSVLFRKWTGSYYAVSAYTQALYVYTTSDSAVIPATEDKPSVHPQSSIPLSLPLPSAASLLLLTFDSVCDTSTLTYIGGLVYYRRGGMWAFFSPTGTIELQGYGLPVAPAACSYFYYVLRTEEYAEEHTIRVATYTPYSLTCSVTSVQSPRTGLPAVYLLSFNTKTVPAGGTFVVSVPSEFGNLGVCKVVSGLQLWACSAHSGTYEISAISSYVASTELILALTLTGQSAGLTGNFQLSAYGSDLSMPISSGACSNPVPLQTQSASQLNVRGDTGQSTMKPACLSQTANLDFQLTPSLSYQSGDSLTVLLPAGLIVPLTPLVCLWTNSTNTIPLEQCQASNSQVAISLPDQIIVQPLVSYTLSLHSESGFTLPTTIDTGVLGFYIVIKTAGGTVREAGKVLARVCGAPFPHLQLTPGHRAVAEASFLQLAFKTSTAVSAAAQVTITFPASMQLGDINCLVEGLKTSCRTVGETLLVSVPAGLSAGVLYTLRIAGFRNPEQAIEAIHGDPVQAYISVALIDKQSELYASWDLPLFPLPLESAPLNAAIGLLTVTGTDQVQTFLSGSMFLSYTFTNSPGAMLVSTLRLVFSAAFQLPEDPVICSLGGLNKTCYQFPGLNWLLVDTGGIVLSTGSELLISNMKTPMYTVAAGYPLRVDVISAESSLVASDSALLSALKPATVSPLQVTRSTPPLTSARSAFDIYSIHWNTPFSAVQQATLSFPPEYPWTTATCSVDVQGVTCTTDCNTEICSKKITLLGSLPEQIQVTVGALSPGNSGSTGNFSVTFYASQSDLSKVVATGLASAPTIQPHTSLFDYTVHWIKQPASLLVQQGHYGTLAVAFKAALSPHSLVTLSFPASVQIALSTTPVCSVRFGSNPLTEFPLLRPRKSFLAMDTAWTDSKLTMRLPGLILREWYGTEVQHWFQIECTSTRGANGDSGFGAPEPGFYPVTITTPTDTLSSEVLINPLSLAGLYAVPSLLDAGAKVVLTIGFTPSCPIPSGYPNIENGKVGAQAWITVDLDVYSGFDPNLGEHYNDGDSVPCQASSGLTGTIACVFHPGDLSTRKPAQILISGFNLVQTNTWVELQFAQIRYPLLVDTQSKVTVGVRQTKEGRELWTLLPSSVLLPSAVVSTANTRVESGVRLSTNLIYSNSTVYLPVSPVALYSGDTLLVSLGEFQLCPDFTVFLDGLKLSKAFSIDNLLVCNVTQEMLLTGTSELAISGLVNPLLPGPQAFAWSVTAANRKQYERTGEVTISIGKATIDRLELSNYKAEGVYVSMEVSFKVPSAPTTPASITIQLPATYPKMTQSSPVPTCTCTLLGSECTVLDRSVRISAVFPIITTISLNLQGLKNPAVPGPVTGFSLAGTDSQGRMWTQTSDFRSVSLTSPAPVGVLSLTINPTLRTGGVVTSYSLGLKAALQLPPKVTFRVSFPGEYSLGSDVECVSVSGVETYWACGRTSSTGMLLTTMGEIAENTSLTVLLDGVKSPLGPLGAFAALVEYDSQPLARSVNVEIALSPAPASTLSFTSITFSPPNEGMQASYTLSLQLGLRLPSTSLNILRIRFPSDFTPFLAYFSSQISTSSVVFSQSKVAGQRTVDLWELKAEIASGAIVKVTVYSVANPWRGPTQSFAAYILNSAGTEVLAYTDVGGVVTIAPPLASPPVLPPITTLRTLPVVNIQFDEASQGLVRTGLYTLDYPPFTPYGYIQHRSAPVGAGPQGVYFWPWNSVAMKPNVPYASSLAFDFSIRVIKPGVILSLGSLQIEASSDGYLIISLQGETTQTSISLEGFWQRVVIYLSTESVGTSITACSGKLYAIEGNGNSLPTEPAQLVLGGGFEGNLLNVSMYNTTNVLLACNLDVQPSSCLISQIADSTCTPCAKGCLSCVNTTYCGPCADPLWADCSVSYSQASTCVPAATQSSCSLSCPDYCLTCAVVASNKNCIWCQRTGTGEAICPYVEQPDPPYPLASCLNCNQTEANLPTFVLVSGLRATPVLHLLSASYIRTLIVNCSSAEAKCVLNQSEISSFHEAYIEVEAGFPLAVDDSEFLLTIQELGGLPVLDILIKVEHAQNTPISVLFTPAVFLIVSINQTFRLSLLQEPLGIVRLKLACGQQEVEISPNVVDLTGKEVVDVTFLARDGAKTGEVVISALDDLYLVTNPLHPMTVTPVQDEIPSNLTILIQLVGRHTAYADITLTRYAEISYYLHSEGKASRSHRVFTNIEDFACRLWLNRLSPGTHYELVLEWGGITQGRNSTYSKAFRTRDPWEDFS